MSLEAAAGKNPVSHVGMLYNVAAHRAAEAIVATLADVARAQCYLVSEIGRPITEPTVAHLKLAWRDGRPAEGVEARAAEILREEIRALPRHTECFALGEIELF